MPAFLVGHITVHDPEKMRSYESQVEDVAQKFGGVLLARGGHPPDMTGADVRIAAGTEFRKDQRHVIIRFPSFEEAQNYWDSDEYAPLKALRESGMKSEGVIIDAPDGGGE